MGANCTRPDICSTGVEVSPQDLRKPQLRACLQDCSSGQTCSSWSVLPNRQEVFTREDLDQEVAPTHQHFAILHGSPGRPVSSWRSRYALGRELGSGQTASVFEAFASAPRLADLDLSRPQPVTSPRPGDEMSGGSSPSCDSGRKVALKRFHNRKTLMFKTELKALLVAGVHPHVIRLLESFEGGTEEDAIVLEHCDGGDIYELYASTNGRSMQETFVAQLMRQLLQALQHLVDRGIEHRDVKPENLLLYASADAIRSQQVPLIKLADFGWAAVVGRSSPPPTIPIEGVGSLWYAPPELNPPVKGAEVVVDELQGGKSDMWSVGVITYLLLTGHSPFNVALNMKDPDRREAEVIRLAAFGKINVSTKVWNMDLSSSARDFILALIRPDPAKRLSPTAALQHEFIAASSSPILCGGFRACVNPGMAEDPDAKWNALDGFQRLCWLAIARAVTEPELVHLERMKDFICREASSSGYMEHLAAELVCVASPAWFTSQAAWMDVLYLAFLYLDVDCDGFLSVDDLSIHLPGTRAREVSHAAICKWCRNHQAFSSGASIYLTYVDFHQAVCSASAASVFPWMESAPSGISAQSYGIWDAALVHRMEAIEEVCRKFASEDIPA